ncbi:MAG: pectin acetylesterase-family hydrolase, partial [Thermodesulfobacteriota bacterium]
AALAAALLAASTLSAGAADFPVSGASLVLRRARGGAETLSFVSHDTALPLPAVGGPDDPSVAGVLVEVVALDDPSVGVLEVPPGVAPRAGRPGWRVAGAGATPTFRYANRNAPGSPSAVRTLLYRPGRRLALAAKRVGIDLDAPLGAVAVRVTVGAHRICALFAGASVVRDQAGLFQGRNAPAPALPDCSDASLGTVPFLRPGLFGDPACADALPSPPEDPPALPPGPEAFHRVTHDDPLAVCNDGHPAVFYVRRAKPGGGHEGDWVIWLAGGGSCVDAGDCADRWCARQDGGYSSRTMSARWKDWDENHVGIFSTRADNRFKDFNLVIAPYCSSDLWTGTHTVDQPSSTSPETGVPYPAYRVAFHGHHIVNALIARLRAGVTSDDGRETLAPLTTAERVLFAGSSAGGAGAIHNASRVAALIRERAPGIVVELLSDGITRPYLPDPARGVSDAEVAVRRAVGAQASSMYRGILDPGCTTAHAGDPLHPCAQAAHVLAHHVPLRAFTQIDLEDPVAGPWAYDDLGRFGLATRELLQGLAAGTSQVPEPLTPVDLGILAPRCRHHVTLDNPTFYELRVPDGGANLNRALWAWWSGAAVPELIDDGSATGSSCAPGP